MTKKEIEKIVEYINIKGSLNGFFKGYSMLYSMTTENISDFINQYDLKNKRVLTVAGSGDQRLNCLLRGASEVICFDVNPLAELQLRLKNTAIKELSHEDFLKFFGVRKAKANKNNSNMLDKEIYSKLRGYLDEDVSLFYDFVIRKFRANPVGKVYTDFESDYSYKRMKKVSNYVSKDNYMRMPEIIDGREINFLNANVFDLPDMLYGEKFDMILLSNISDYIHYFYGNDHMVMYKEIIDRLVDNLYDGGIIQVGYIYTEDEYRKGKRYDDYSKFHIEQSRNKVFPSDEYPIQSVVGFYGKKTYDRIVTYQKKL